MVKILALCASLLLTACQTAPSGDFCDLAEPRRHSPEEIAQMSDEKVAEDVEWNRLGQRLCGWRE